MRKNKKLRFGQGIRLDDMTPPVKAETLADGKKVCNGCSVPKTKEEFPKGGGSTCKTCLNAKATIKREEKKKDFIF